MMKWIVGIFAMAALLLLAGISPVRAEVPKVGDVAIFAMGCETLADTKRLAEEANKSDGDAQNYAQAEGNSCGFMRGPWTVLEVVEKVGKVYILRVEGAAQPEVKGYAIAPAE